MNPQNNGPIEEEKKNQVNDSCYSGSNCRFLKQIFHVITHLEFISNIYYLETKIFSILEFHILQYHCLSINISLFSSSNQS